VFRRQNSVAQRAVEEMVLPGLSGGMLAGLLMASAAILAATFAGLSPGYPLQLVAAILMGPSSLELGLGSALLGLVVHLLISGAWGVLYASMLPRGASYAYGAGFGLLFGLGAFLVMTYMVLPWLNPVAWRAFAPLVHLPFHLLFGAALVAVLPLRRAARVAASGPSTPGGPKRRSL
jgi:hypothetical protein